MAFKQLPVPQPKKKPEPAKKKWDRTDKDCKKSLSDHR
jgi:hypothetical protein